MKAVKPEGSCNFSRPWWIMRNPAERRRRSKHKSEENCFDFSWLMTSGKFQFLRSYTLQKPVRVRWSSWRSSPRKVALVKPSLVHTSPTCPIRWWARQSPHPNQSDCRSAIGTTSLSPTIAMHCTEWDRAGCHEAQARCSKPMTPLPNSDRKSLHQQQWTSRNSLKKAKYLQRRYRLSHHEPDAGK